MNHPSPLIGVMTAQKSNGSIAGNSQLFIGLQKELAAHHALSYIFTVEGVDKEFITGYIFSFDHNRWIKKNFPYPDLVYNRIPFRKAEKDEAVQHFFANLKERKIPFFNPCFIDKFELYQLIKNHPILKSHLPATILANEKQELRLFLNQYSQIYLKPANSSRGRGIYRMSFGSANQICLEGLKERFTYSSFEQFWDHWCETLMNKPYLAQEDILSAEYQGYRYDFRILAHSGKSGYQVTGVGIRQSQKQEITTHIPAGGKLLPYSIVQCNAHDHFIETIIPAIGPALSERYGFFGEFTVDAGISESGQYFIYEVNSKPMNFDELEIEEKKITRLCELFLQLTDQKSI
ncbi:YheC/YheD family protein [Neobacillus muris]|uniref:YheC/YheD family endospore coat-associated protein n=1 Tax=Neobacillus muris TaxID=2941334 RepID=UPI00203EF188|nr:YheC/YheD family protein [Neobacillus muris]